MLQHCFVIRLFYLWVSIIAIQMLGKPFLYSDQLKQWDIITIVIYVLFTLGVFIAYRFGSADSARIILLAYVVITQLSIYFYGALRNFKLYLIWCGFGILHIIMYFLFKGNHKLDMVKVNPSPALLNTIILLLLFQLLRFVSIKTQHRELVALREGNSDDNFDNVKPSVTDKILFFVYVGSWIGLSYLAL